MAGKRPIGGLNRLSWASSLHWLTLPKVPDQAGSYVLDLYIEGMQLAKLPFTVG